MSAGIDIGIDAPSPVVDHPLATLREIVQRARRASNHTCDMCAVPIDGDHRHVVDTVERGLKCLCTACYLLFSDDAAAGGRYRQVRDRYVAVDDFQISPAEWDELQVPVGLAFFFADGASGRTHAFYPGPAGATESQLPLDAWERIAAKHTSLADVAADIEAILVRRRPREHDKHDAFECYIVPIDACYHLVGTLRLHWSGFDGGSEAREEIERFFDNVNRRARRAGGGVSSHA